MGRVKIHASRHQVDRMRRTGPTRRSDPGSREVRWGSPAEDEHVSAGAALGRRDGRNDIVAPAFTSDGAPSGGGDDVCHDVTFAPVNKICQTGNSLYVSVRETCLHLLLAATGGGTRCCTGSEESEDAYRKE